MKKKIISLALVVAVLFAMSGMTFAQEISENGDSYIEFEIPMIEEDVVQPDGSILRVARAVSPLTGNYGVLNAYFARGETEALSAAPRFNFRDDTLPINARVTNVTLTSTRTAVSGITYYIAIGKAGEGWCPDMIWRSTVSTSHFNGTDPWGEWAFELYATRLIPNPDYDFGAAATLTSSTLRVYYS